MTENLQPSPGLRFAQVIGIWVCGVFALGQLVPSHAKLAVFVAFSVACVIGGAIFVAAGARNRSGWDLLAFGVSMALLLAILIGTVTVLVGAFLLAGAGAFH